MLKRHFLRLLAYSTLAGLVTLPALSHAQSSLISQGKPVTASSQEAGLAPAAAVDGNAASRWGSDFSDNQWLQVDLGESMAISRVVLNWEAAYGKAYQIQTSEDGRQWSTAYSTTTGDGGIDDITATGQGRYVRVNALTRATGYGFSLWEFQVYGSKPATASLISRDARVVASSQEGGFIATSVVDGNADTRWGSNFNDNEWIYLDLGQGASINRAVLRWEAAFARGYQLQVSNDARQWTTLYTTTTGDGGTDDIALNGSGRYLRMLGTKRATGYGYSLWEFEAYGSRGGSGSSSSASPGSSARSSSSSVTSQSSTATSLSSTATSQSSNATSRSSSATSLSSRISSSAPMSLSSSSVRSSSAFSSASSSSVETGTPDFGSNVIILDPSMPQAQMQERINDIYAIQRNNQFGSPRTALLFKPGAYDLDVPVGFFTQVAGLGALPDRVNITNRVHSDPILANNNATQNFWRGVENFAVTPPGGGMQWAVSQAVPFRRMHVISNNLTLHAYGGWASGGFIADSKIDFDVGSGSQQQWVSRNAQWGSWTGNLWNMVFVGIADRLPGGTWPQAANTIVAQTPVVREKPFLYLDGENYEVFVPALRSNSAGISWGNGQSTGESIPLDAFYVARAGVDSAASINAALAQGKHLLLTPGIYDISEPISVTRADTVVLGMGFATLHPTNGTAAIKVADVDGVKLAHVFVEAGVTNTPVLVEIGAPDSNASHASNPASLHDVFIRVGGAIAGKADASLVINSNDVIIDHTWLWRADHGENNSVGWSINTARNGLVVNGDRVTAYGLFVEHFQEYQVLWNGDYGRTYFYQSEIPYDPPTQPLWRSAPGVNGWASYKVADNVSHHEAWGLGVYAVFLQPDVYLSRAIEVPDTPGVKFHHMVTVNLTANGAIQNVINNTGGATAPGVAVTTPRVTDYPAP